MSQQPQTQSIASDDAAASGPGGRKKRPSVKREAILETAERLFYDNGFHATGIDRIVEEACVTLRTLYSHFGSKDDLVCAVLRRREDRYFEHFDEFTDAREKIHGDPVRAAFEALVHWLNGMAAQGCMFISALNEYPDPAGAVAGIVAAHKERVREGLKERLARSGIKSDETLVGGLLILMEGATGLAPVIGSEKAGAYAVEAARSLIASRNAA